MQSVDAGKRLEKCIDFYKNSIQNFVEFSKTDRRSKPQLMKRLAALEREAAEATPGSPAKVDAKP